MSGVRLDLLLAECVGTVVKQFGGINGAQVWEMGGRELAIAKLRELGITNKPVTLVDVARGCGVLGPDPDVVVIEKENRPRVRRVPRV